MSEIHSEIFIVQGRAEHLEILYEEENLENLGHLDYAPCWTCPGTAKPGDLLLFYLMRPLSSIVGTAQVAAEPFVNNDLDSEWFGARMAEYENLTMLAREDYLSLWQMQEFFPAWHWTKRPQGAVKIPDIYKKDLLSFLKI